MAKILIADPSEEQCAAIAAAIGNGHILRFCHDGSTAREMLSSFRPDAIVLELRLQQLDGLTLLEGLDPLARPAVLVYTGCCTDYVQFRLDHLADYVMFKPGSLATLATRLTDMIRVRQDPRFPTEHLGTVQALLLELMNHPGRSGYAYLLCATELFAANPTQAITKELYPAVGRRFNTNGSCVEKSIRDAIEQAWKERDNNVWRKYFHTDRYGQVCKPTNKDFLATIVNQLQPQHHRAL